MNVFIILAGLSMSSVNDRLLSAIEKVESAGNAQAVSDGGMAVGAYQIWPCVIEDVNRAYKTKYTLSDRTDRSKSRDICRLYLEFWGKQYEKKTGKKATMEVYSRCFNGGPNGWNKKSTEKYWQKVKSFL